jgi:adenosine deaminase
MSPVSTTLTTAKIQRLPKVELHVHLEGTIEPERIAALAAAAGADLPRPLDRIYEANDLSEFLAFLDWVGSLVTTPDIAAGLAYEFAERAHQDYTLYAEVIVNPTHWPALALPDLLEGIAAGFDRAQADGLTDCRILPSILRQQSAESAEAMASHLVEQRPSRVVGLSIDGNEAVAGRTAERFERAYAIAGGGGLGLTAHAGESSGPDGVSDALDVLHVDRVDHGIRAIEDPELIARLVDEGQALNVCVTSNCRRMYPDVHHHPILELMAAGVTCTINTDDPAPMECSLTSEFEMVADAAGLDAAGVAAITRNAIDASFCDDATKAQLGTAIDAWTAEVAT